MLKRRSLTRRWKEWLKEGWLAGWLGPLPLPETRAMLESRTPFSERAAIVGLLLLIAACLASLACHDSDPIRSSLPKVEVPTRPEAAEPVLCHDFEGRRPDKYFIPDTTRQPRLCFIGDVCFYSCPLPAGST